MMEKTRLLAIGKIIFGDLYLWCGSSHGFKHYCSDFKPVLYPISELDYVKVIASHLRAEIYEQKRISNVDAHGFARPLFGSVGGGAIGHQSGQVLVEYLLTLGFVVALGTIVGTYLLNKVEAFLL